MSIGAATAGTVWEMTARTGVHGRNELEIRRICHGSFHSRDSHLPFLQRLTQRLQGCSGEFRKLVKEQNPAGGKRYLPRLVSAALKVVTDIERIGDHVADMVELYLRMGNMNSEGKQEKLLLKMMEEAKDMIHNSVEAFVEGDEANAQKVVEHDDVVDDLFNDMKKEMMQAIREQNLDADRVVDYLMMAKYLEKVGDHAVNIAQWAIFRMTGDMEGVKLY